MIVGLHVLLHFARLNTRAAFFALSHQAATSAQRHLVVSRHRGASHGRVGSGGGFGRLATMVPHFRFSSRWCSLAVEV